MTCDLLVAYRTQCSYYNKQPVLEKLIEEVEGTLTGEIKYGGLVCVWIKLWGGQLIK